MIITDKEVIKWVKIARNYWLTEDLDEFEEDEEELTKINEREYLLSGSMNLEDLCETLSLPFSSEDYDTIGGYLIGLLEHFPKEGESFTTKENITLRVQKMDKNRIDKVHLYLPAKELPAENPS